MSIFQLNTKSHLTKTCFFDETVDIARYDRVRYPAIAKLDTKMRGYQWLETDIDMTPDSKDFKTLDKSQQHIITANLSRQIMLDTFQGKGPCLAFLPICSLPELESAINAWEFFETIHSKSYTHMVQNVFPNPTTFLDGVLQIGEIVNCANDISKYYDDLITWNSIRDLHLKGFEVKYDEYEHKKALWLAINAVYALEAIRFYVSFACSWAFAELGVMKGNAKLIRLICRDENLHKALSLHLLKILPKEDPNFVAIKAECETQVYDMIMSVVNQEKEWAKYVFSLGSIIGLNEPIICEFVEWTAKKAMEAIGMKSPFDVKSDPLPWTQNWISGKDNQVAPQEEELTGYELGGIHKDITDDTFANFSL